MRKMKKFAALVLAGAMVLGMSTTAMAAPKATATITVTNADGASFTYAQVIEPNTRTATGWDIVDTYAKAYTDAFALTNADSTAADVAAAEQTALAMLIKKVDAAAALPTALASVDAASDSQIDTALNNILATNTVTGTMTNPQTVDKAGVYAINAAGSGFTYKVMAAYIGFGGVNVDGDNQTYDYPSLMDASLGAKKIPTTITKYDNDVDNAVAIDQRVTYTLKTNFPYFKANETNRTFKITDTITGASYVDLDNAEKAYVTIGGTKVAATFDKNGNSFTVDLSSYAELADNNVYANQEVVVTYDAIVDDTEVVNGATSQVGGSEYDSNVIKLYSGEITLLKYDAADTTKATVLENAGFNVKNAAGEVLTFEYDEVNKVYTYNKDLDASVAANVEIFTDATGKVKVEGLDIGTYTFVEVKAPDGYSINETPSTATLVVEEKNTSNEATAIFDAETEMSDTKLLALPSTGGIGTTMFTIGGVVIILAAAAMLFARRRVAK